MTFTFKSYGNSRNKTFLSQRVWIGYNIELANWVYWSLDAMEWKTVKANPVTHHTLIRRGRDKHSSQISSSILWIQPTKNHSLVKTSPKRTTLNRLSTLVQHIKKVALMVPKKYPDHPLLNTNVQNVSPWLDRMTRVNPWSNHQLCYLLLVATWSLSTWFSEKPLHHGSTISFHCECYVNMLLERENFWTLEFRADT